MCATIEVSCFDASGHAQKIAFYFTSRPTTHRKWMAYLVLWWVKTSSPTTYLLHHHREFRVMPRGLVSWPVWRVRSIFQSKAFILLLPFTIPTKRSQTTTIAYWHVLLKNTLKLLLLLKFWIPKERKVVRSLTISCLHCWPNSFGYGSPFWVKNILGIMSTT